MLTEPFTQFARAGEYRFDFWCSITLRGEKLRSPINLQRELAARALGCIREAPQCSQRARKMTGGFYVRRALRSLFSRCFPMQYGRFNEVRGRVMLSNHFGRCCDHGWKLARQNLRDLTMQRLSLAF